MARGRARNTWTHDQRVTLHLMHTRSIPKDKHVAIFNTIFAPQLRRYGYPSGLEKNAIASQYGMRNRTEVKSVFAPWRRILTGPASAEEAAKWEMLAEQIARVARTIPDSGRATPSAASQPTRRRQFDVGSVSGPGSVAMPGRFRNAEEDGEEFAPPTPTPPQCRRKRQEDDVSFPSFQTMAEAIDLTDSDDEYTGASTARCSLLTFVHPPSTRSTLKRRNSTVVQHRSVADDDYSRAASKRVKFSPEVVVPTTPKRRGRPPKAASQSTGLRSLPKTSSSIARRRARANNEYHRPNGTIMLTDKELKATQGPLVPPPESVAHPPLAGLLFRYWTDDCFSKLDERGEFVAGKFANFSTFGSGPQPLPSLQHFDYFWHDVGAHMNREPVHSPWISTCNNLLWIVRLAVQESKKGVTSGRITVLNAHAIDRRSVFHAQPLHKELCKKRPFTKGAFRYAGMREFLVYHKIPKKAVLHTFTVQELPQLAVVKPGVGDLLRLHNLSRTMTAMNTLLQTLKDQNLKLSRHTVMAIAEIVRLFGFKSDAATEHIMHMVSDIVQGWCLTVSYQSPEQWSGMADIFASALITTSGTSWMKDYQRMKLAFLDGVRWSQGDINARHKAERMQTMLARARKAGLDDPGKILRDELDAAKLGIVIYDQKQQRLLQRSASRTLLAGPEDEDDSEDDAVPAARRAIEYNLDDEIMYDSDDN